MSEQLFRVSGCLHGVWRYRWSGLLITWVVAIVGLAVVMLIPNTYEVRAVFHADTPSTLNTLSQGLAVEDQETSADVAFVKRKILSRKNLLAVIRDTDSDLQARDGKSLDMIAAKLATDIRIEGGNNGRRGLGSGANIYEITYSSHSPERAYKVVSTLIENTIKTERVDETSVEALPDKQVKEYENRLTEAEQRLAEFKKQNVGKMPDERGGYYSRLHRSEVEAEKTKTEIKLAEKRLAEIRKQLSGQQPFYSPGAVDIQTRKDELYSQLEQLLRRYTDKHPDVIALRRKIESLSDKDAMSATHKGSDETAYEANPVYQELKVEESKVNIDLETLRLTRADQEKQIAKLRAVIDSIPEVEAEYARLNRDYEVANKRYLELVERRETARLDREAKQSASEIKLRVIDRPILPLEPLGPDRKLYSLVIFLAAIGLGIAWGFVRFMMHPAFFGERQLKDAFSIPVLGSVGLNKTERDRKRRTIQALGLIGSIVVLACVFGVAVMFEEQLISFVHPHVSRWIG